MLRSSRAWLFKVPDSMKKVAGGGPPKWAPSEKMKSRGVDPSGGGTNTRTMQQFQRKRASFTASIESRIESRIQRSKLRRVREEAEEAYSDLVSQSRTQRAPERAETLATARAVLQRQVQAKKASRAWRAGGRAHNHTLQQQLIAESRRKS
jgi:hypothetical protein